MDAPRKTHPHVPPEYRAREQEERKQRILTHGTPSVVRDISDAIVMKDHDIFLLTQPDGNIPIEPNHGLGLYYHDCRFLNGYDLRIADQYANLLIVSAAQGFASICELTNPDIRLSDGRLIAKESMGLQWERVLDAQRLALFERITIRNYGLQEIAFPLSMRFTAEFEDVYEVRGLMIEDLGQIQMPEWHAGALRLAYWGRDSWYRCVTVHFSPRPTGISGSSVCFEMAVPPRAHREVRVSLLLTESREAAEGHPAPHAHPELAPISARRHDVAKRWTRKSTQVTVASLAFQGIVDRALRDLEMLGSVWQGKGYFAAGVPWFATLFGRDSIITALQMLAFDSGIAEQTARLLAQYQGTQVDHYRDEQPGKILHELRVGELAHLGDIPHTPYYGTVDATPLFLILLAEHAQWTGSLALFEELREHVERALAWLENERSRDGYLGYQSAAEKGLINQGWKDSGDAIVNSDGSLAKPPIKMVEVQAYVYRALTSIADLFEREGATKRASHLAKQAQSLREAFNRDFWFADRGHYALALQAGNEPAAVSSSNPGHALWAGIADTDKARATAERLMAPDMFSGWGVRTLSTKERRYNPIGYHLGTVWPHDNSLIAAGLRRYGYDDAARQIAAGIIEAAALFDIYRLPELFAGFPRSDYGVPVNYPVACHPQAWAAGTVPYMLQILLGLVPDGFNNRLRIVRPILPAFVHELELRNLRVAHGEVHLRFERHRENVTVEVMRARGLDVQMEQA